MNKVLIFCLLLVTTIFGATKSNWTHTYKYSLKKDEISNISFSTTESKGSDTYSFFFRWTTIVGNRVTVLLNYKGYPHQYILYKKRLLNRVKLFILQDGSRRNEDRSYVIIELANIDQDKKIVDFNIFVKDDKNRVMVDFQPK